MTSDSVLALPISCRARNWKEQVYADSALMDCGGATLPYHITELVVSSGNAADFYSGGSHFEYRPERRLSRLMFFMVVLSPDKQM
jgi:hypothetical protein